MPTASEPKIKVSLKLFVDTNAGNKVLFAEAGKDFVDFLLYLLSLPLATVTRILKEDMVGSLAKLYETVESLSESYLLPNQNKKALLNPRVPISATEIPLLLSDYELHNRESYGCSNCHLFVADVPNLMCPRCNQKMTSALSYVPPSPANTGFPVDGGFIKGLMTFIVKDNLEFMPMSTKDVVPLLKTKEGILELGLTLDEHGAMKLLQLSLQSKTVLTKLLTEYSMQLTSCQPL
ncbi:uncharacterized protein LOC123228348 isoform X1 [Mangifera indica]|uniref:uncharacterized protein LOC123228348 isoform X1 n=2 Tax=Mangifera indica TaxID=29780 RepID=UPI001CF97582|nr:uncharacterized protein LOC123228348 isoform X1 [Mangifera indica]